MIESFPVEFTLESGTHVTVTKAGANSYDFSLKPTEDLPTTFSYVDDGRSKSEWDDKLDFEQLQALRKFWLENEDVV
jgi:hypothetical protein